MSASTRNIPASSQTVGPYFRIGLQHLIDAVPQVRQNSGVTIRGRVLDSNGAPVTDAMLEVWSPACGTTSSSDAFPLGFRRVGTDLNGTFTIALPRPKPGPLGFEDGLSQAPHFLVLVFARGLLRHLITRLYLDDEPSNALDPVLLSVPGDRRKTLIAHSEQPDIFRWDVILQGIDETVFFAW